MAESTEIEERRLKMILRSAIPEMSWAWITGLVIVTALGLTTFKSFAVGNQPSSGVMEMAIKEPTTGSRGDRVLATLLRGITNNYSKVQSARGTFVVQYKSSKDAALEKADGLKEAKWSDLYTWSFSGKKFREEKIRTSNGYELRKKITSFDGRKAYAWDPSEDHGIVFNGLPGDQEMSFVSGYLQLLYKYNSDRQRTMEESIRDSRPHVVGKEVLDNIECYKLKGTSAEGAEHTWWIAPDKGYCVKRHEWMSKAPGRRRVIRHRAVMDVSRFTRYADSIWLPAESTIQLYGTLSDGVERLSWRITTRTDNLAVNVEIDPMTFRIEFPAGMHVAHITP